MKAWPCIIVVVAGLLFVLFPLTKVIGDDSLVLYFSFDEGKGNVAKDHSKYQNDGKFFVLDMEKKPFSVKNAVPLKTEPKWVDGKSGKALAFSNPLDRSSGYFIEVPDSDNSLDLTNKGHTISFWFQWDGKAGVGTKAPLGGWSPFISKAYAEYDGGNYATWVGKDRKWDYQNSTGGAGKATQKSAKTLLPLDNKWIFLVVTHDGKETVSYYINGSLDSTGTMPLFEVNDAALRVGHDGFSPVVGAGTLDEIAIFNRPLNGKEILTLMKAGVVGITGAPTAVQFTGKLATIWGRLKY